MEVNERRRGLEPVLRWVSNPELAEALNTPMPSRPPLARLPPSFKAPPPFFDNLTRSTMPTASLSPPPYVSSYPISHTDPKRPPPIVLNHSHPPRSSLDTLRSVHTRAQSTFSPAIIQQPEPQPSGIVASWSSWWSQPSKEALLEQQDRAETKQQKEQIKQKYLSPNNPVVFCHGLLGFDSVTIGLSIAPVEVTHWRGIKEVLEENGTRVLITRVPATSSPIDRAKVLEQKISATFPGQSVHLIGHSMGGLDCRYLTSHLKERKFNVLSITTIATPHRGSAFADHFLSAVGRDRMPSVLSLLDLLPNGGGDGKAFESLTIESMHKFNQETPDVEGVRYFSWGATYDPGLIDTWKWPHSVILEKEGPNDGLVSVESAKWGTYLGTLSGVNHLDLVGWINTARYKWAEMMGKEIKFRPATFYLGIADMLAKEVEGQKNADSNMGKAGAGVELEEGRHGRGESLDASGVPPRSRSQNEREQMLDSLDTAGADVKEVGAKDADSKRAPVKAKPKHSSSFSVPNLPNIGPSKPRTK